jgi:hypothetical protein
MPVLGICGDSWFAATLNIDRDDCRDSEGKHFSEILAKKLNYDLFTLARGACSNSAIRLQISEMVKKKVDFIIVGVTSSNRIEYPKFDNRTFDPTLGIYNVYYSHTPDRSAMHFSKQTEVLISDTLTNIFGNQFNSAPVRSEEQRDAIKSYYLEMFDINFREQQDAWIMASGIQEIRDAGIPYLLLGLPWLNHTSYFKDTERDILHDNHRGLIPCGYGVSGIRRWHTTDDVQIQLADNLYDYIIKNNLL